MKIARDDCPCEPEGWMTRVLLRLALVALVLYRATPRRVRCRRPGMSCSRYMTWALAEQGLVRGLGNGLLYIADCKASTRRHRAGQSWGDDPMPDCEEWCR